MRIRLARTTDLNRLAALCRAAVGPDDYVLEFLKEKVRAREVSVVEVRRRIVSMLGFTPCPDGSLWLGQIRTHPAFRRRGLASLLIEDARVRAARARRPALRMWISVRNTASRRMAESTGFRRVAVFSRRVAGPDEGPSRVGVTRRADDAFERWRRSALRPAGSGYLCYEYHFLPLTLSTLRRIASARHLLMGPKAVLVFWRENTETGGVSVLAGGREALLAARRAVAERRLKHVWTFLPRTAKILRSARQAGFVKGSWGSHAIVYERPVRQTVRSTSRASSS